MLTQTIGFLGAGKMGAALARGILDAKLVLPGQIAMSEVDEARATTVANELRVRVLQDSRDVIADSDVVVLALKPGVVRQELPALADAVTEDKLVVSIAAGVTLLELDTMLGGGRRIVRVMPNAPCQVGAGASAFTLGSGVSEADVELVVQLLAAVGICVGPVPESQLDAVTGLSGSGPAYVALVIEALADGGVLCGLSRDVALKLAAQTVLGAARMVLEAGKGKDPVLHPAALKDMVASPGGTTIEGLQVLEAHGLRAALIDAVEAATLKSRALGAK